MKLSSKLKRMIGSKLSCEHLLLFLVFLTSQPLILREENMMGDGRMINYKL